MVLTVPLFMKKVPIIEFINNELFIRHTYKHAYMLIKRLTIPTTWNVLIVLFPVYHFSHRMSSFPEFDVLKKRRGYVHFKDWKDAMRAFRDHEKSKYYKEATESMVQIPATIPDIGEMLVVQLSQQKQQNREMLLHILWAVHFLAR